MSTNNKYTPSQRKIWYKVVDLKARQQYYKRKIIEIHAKIMKLNMEMFRYKL